MSTDTDPLWIELQWLRELEAIEIRRQLHADLGGSDDEAPLPLPEPEPSDQS